MRTINILVSGCLDEENVEKIKTLNVPQAGCEFVAIKLQKLPLRHPPDWTFRSPEEARKSREDFVKLVIRARTHGETLYEVPQVGWLTVRGRDEDLFKLLFDIGGLDDEDWKELAAEMPASWAEEMKRDYYLTQKEESIANQEAETNRRTAKLLS